MGLGAFINSGDEVLMNLQRQRCVFFFLSATIPLALRRQLCH